MSIIDTLGLRADWDRARLAQERTAPLRAYQYVDVTFLTADTDTAVPHQLGTPDTLCWVPCQLSAGAVVYRAPGTAATTSTLVLRASAPCVCRLLLWQPR